MQKHVIEFAVFVGTMVVVSVLVDLVGWSEFLQGALSAIAAVHLARIATTKS